MYKKVYALAGDAYFREKQFRKEFSCLGEIQAYLDTTVNIVALTATVTKST